MESKKKVPFLFLFLLGSCGQLQSNRQFISEMEQDDQNYFNPREDFPLVSGDSGRFWNTEKEQLERTPSSAEEVMRYKMRYSLDSELKTLEESFPENNLRLYEQYKHRFHTVSEKIYFLKLQHSERIEYLEAKGFTPRPVAKTTHHTAQTYYSNSDHRSAARSGEILPGMSKGDVITSWGNPQRVEVAGNPSYENERWLYQVDGAAKYIYFESGRVQGWE